MTDWLTYEWEFRGERATFRVDMQYWELLPVLSYSQLIYVCAAPKDSLAKEFNKVEQYRFRMLRHRLIDELEGRAIHVGSVYTDTLRCLYFYAAETDVIQQASAICREYGMLAITCAHASEPHFTTYYRFLYPDDARLQSVENAVYIEAMRKKGSDLEMIRRVTLTLSFLTVEDRSAFLKDVPKLGFTPGGTSWQGESTHPACCTVSGFTSLSLPKLNKFTARAISAAAPLEGMLTDIDAEYVKRY